MQRARSHEPVHTGGKPRSKIHSSKPWQSKAELTFVIDYPHAWYGVMAMHGHNSISEGEGCSGALQVEESTLLFPVSIALHTPTLDIAEYLIWGTGSGLKAQGP